MSDMPLPDFRSQAFLRRHIADTMAFYHPRAIDPRGGFFHYFRDDGSVYDASHRHLVSSTRFVFNYAMAAREFGDDAVLQREYVAAARHGLRYLRDVHRDSASGGYAWTIRDGVPEDRTNHAYGLAFVLLAYATAVKAGIVEAGPWMDETWSLLESRFWEEAAGLYRDEADADWRFSDYRGQNANMHLCEALLAAFEASADARYLDRALQLADHMTRRQAPKAGGLVWEHYDRDWNVDWDYHRDDPKHLFRPWGFQPGHQTEWTKLLLILDRHMRARVTPIAWLLPTARHLFDTAVQRAWDGTHGGLAYARSEPSIIALTVLAFLTTFLGLPILTFLPVFAREIFHGEVSVYTHMMAFSGAGAVIGALVVAWLGRFRHMGRTLLIVQALFGGIIVAFAMSRVWWWSCVLLFLGGAALIVVFSMTASLVQLIVPDHLRGRVVSIYMVAFRGGMPLGSLAGGYAASLSSAPQVLAVNGTLVSFVALYFLIRSHGVREL